MPLKPGALLRHRYRIENVLGQGGMGAVYRSYDVNLGVAVAVKENLFTTEEYARQFRREATILASLRHPNLPRVTDHFVIEGEGQYLVMDFIEGEDLRYRLEQRGPVPEEEALDWFLEICDALSYLHSRTPPIVHRDIKPGNIKITPDGKAVLVDFGLAKVADEGHSTTSGAKAMTPGFSPPEQYGTGHTDPRSDIYSLGATLYAALTASIPEDALERAMGREKLTPANQLVPKVSSGVSRAIEKALAIRPQERYQSIIEFAAALGGAAISDRPTIIRNYPYLEQTIVTTGKGPPPGTLVSGEVPTRKRRSSPSIAVSALLMVAITVAAWFYAPDLNAGLMALIGPPSPATPTMEPVPSRSAFSPSVTPIVTTQPSPTPTQEIHVIPSDTLEPSPSKEPEPQWSATPTLTPPPGIAPIGGGSGQIAFASDRNGGIPQIFMVDVDGTNPVQLTTKADGACQPAWSPEGTQIVFTSPCRENASDYPNSGLWLIELEDLENPKPLYTILGGAYDPSWSPDGDRIAFTSQESRRPQIWLFDLNTQAATKLTVGPVTVDQHPSWSPDGNQIAFAGTRTGLTGILIMPSYGGEIERLSRGSYIQDTHPDWSSDGQEIVFEREIGGIPRLVAARYEPDGDSGLQICQEGARAGYPMAEPHWSPDGRWIVFETWPEANHNLAIMMRNCNEFQLLTEDPGQEFDASWRPAP